MKVTSEQAYESLDKLIEFGGRAKATHFTNIRNVIEERNRLLKLLKREEDGMIRELRQLADDIHTDIMAGCLEVNLQDKLNRAQQIDDYFRAIEGVPDNRYTDLDEEGENDESR